jgi:hypothetical protein
METPHYFDTICPVCGNKNQVNRGLTTEEAPSEGDASLCVNCGRPSIYYQTPDGLKLRVCTEVERDSIEAQPDYQAAISAMTAIKPSVACSCGRTHFYPTWCYCGERVTVLDFEMSKVAFEGRRGHG